MLAKTYTAAINGLESSLTIIFFSFIYSKLPSISATKIGKKVDSTMIFGE
jgi:hypothetical protein